MGKQLSHHSAGEHRASQNSHKLYSAVLVIKKKTPLMDIGQWLTGCLAKWVARLHFPAWSHPRSVWVWRQYIF